MSEQQPPGAPTPGPGRDGPRLERAPGDRYAAARAADATRATRAGRSRRTRAIIAAVVVSDLGALLFFALGLVDLGIGLVAIAAFVGWAVALALVWWGRDALPDPRLRIGLAALLAGWAIVFAMLIDWLYGLGQGGVLGPLDYVLQRYGLLVAGGSLAVAVGVAAVRAR